MKVPNFMVLCFQCLPEFPVKQVLGFLESPTSQDLNLRAGLEGNMSKRYQAVLKFWHRGIVMEKGCVPNSFCLFVCFCLRISFLPGNSSVHHSDRFLADINLPEKL